MKEQKYIVIMGQRGGGKVAALEEMIKKKRFQVAEMRRIIQFIENDDPLFVWCGLADAQVKIAKLEDEIQELEKEVARIRSKWG